VTTWNLLEFAAWAISGAILLWMVVDAARVGRDYDEDLLLSSREGELEAVAEADAAASHAGSR
jgi:hypothetical protein